MSQVIRHAALSPCGQYRSLLTRLYDREGITAGLFGVNPSKADHMIDDPTVRRLDGFADRLSWRRILLGNLADYRATDPKELARVEHPISELNETHLEIIIAESDILIAMWGPNKKLPKSLRDAWITLYAMCWDAQKPLMCWGTCKDGHPCHPLYLPYETPLVEWRI